MTAAPFDPDAPLPDLRIRQARSWEPAARRYRDLTEEEKQEPQRYCWPTLGEPCGNCHRCTEPERKDQ